jgi:hypothetical protein
VLVERVHDAVDPALRLAQLLLGAARDRTTRVDHARLNTQFLAPFNERLAEVSLAAQQLEVGTFR